MTDDVMTDDPLVGDALVARPFAYSTIFRHPDFDGAPAFDVGGRIRPEIPEQIARECKNESNCTLVLPDGSLVTTWGTGSFEHATDERIVFSVSADAGRTWSPPATIIGSTPEKRIAYGVPHWDAGTGALYLFFHAGNQSREFAPLYDAGTIHWMRSFDVGRTWSEPVAMPLPDRDIDGVPGEIHAWLNHPPLVLSDGSTLLPYTRISSSGLRRRVWLMAPAEVRVLSLEFSAEGVSYCEFPDHPRGIRCELAPNLENPAARRLAEARGGEVSDVVTTFQEMTLAELADGSLLGVGRTVLGSPGCTVSHDRGRTWTPVKPLHYEAGGPPIHHPMTMAPIRRLSDGRVLLLFANNDGSEHGAEHVWDGRGTTRGMQWLSIGEQVGDPAGENAGLRFSPPVLIAEVRHTAGDNLKTGMSMPHAFEIDDELFVAYNVSKEHIVLDKIPTPVLDQENA